MVFSSKLTQLLSNDSFIKWLINPTCEHASEWETLLAEDLQLKNEIDSLKEILANFEIDEQTMDSKMRIRLWSNITSKTIKQRKKRKSIHLWSLVACAATIAILVVSGIIAKYSNVSTTIDYKTIASSVDLNESNDIYIVLDKDQKTIINQNNAEVVYDESGIVKIDHVELTKDAEPSTEDLNKLVVPYGKTSSLTLSDGTKVWINSGSKIIYPPLFVGSNREVYVEGEAYFEVSKNKQMPFIVKSEQITVKVLGTSFNISAYHNEVEQSVVLVEGAVEVRNEKTKEEHEIAPNQKLAYNKVEESTDITTIDTTEFGVRWRFNTLCFASEDLSVVLKKLQRHYNIKFHYDIATLENMKLTGKLDLQLGIHSALQNIALATPIEFTIDNEEKNITISKKKN